MERTEPGTPDAGTMLVLGTVRVDLASGQLAPAVEGRNRLRPVEYALLHRLYREHGGVVSRARLLADVWGYAPTSPSRTVESTVARLRALLGDAEQRYLVTVHGVGYALLRPAPTVGSARVGREDLVEHASTWIASNPGRWLTLAGRAGAGKSALLRALARRSHGAAVRVYVDVELEGRGALEGVLGSEAGPRLVFADLGRLDPTRLGGRPACRRAHTVVLAARAPLDDRDETLLWVR